MGDVIRWTGTGGFDVSVVWESYYQDNLKPIAGDVRRKKCVARLVCEKNNRQDRNAVRVEIDGAQVGYLPRDLAPVHRRRLEESKQAGAVVECEAVAVTGEDGAIGVYLDLPYSDDDADDESFSIEMRPRPKPFVQRYFVALAIAAGVLVLSGAGAPIGLALAVGLGWFRWKRWA
jgi:hypothetical protein